MILKTAHSLGDLRLDNDAGRAIKIAPRQDMQIWRQKPSL